MHEWAKQILECVKSKVNEIGLENIEGQDLDDFKDWTTIAKNIVCYEKDYKIVEEMEKNPDYVLEIADFKGQTAEKLRETDKNSGVYYYTEPETSAYLVAMNNFEKTHDRGNFDKWLNAFIDDMTSQTEWLTPELKTVAKTRLNNALISRL